MNKSLLNKVIILEWIWNNEIYKFEVRIAKITEKGVTLISEKEYSEPFENIIYEGDIFCCITGDLDIFFKYAKIGIVDFSDYAFVKSHADDLSKECSKY